MGNRQATPPPPPLQGSKTAYALRMFAAAASTRGDEDACSRAAQMMLDHGKSTDEAVALLRRIVQEREAAGELDGLELLGLAVALPKGEAEAKAAAQRGLDLRGEAPTPEELLIAGCVSVGASDFATAAALAARAVALREADGSLDGDDLLLVASAVMGQGRKAQAGPLFERALSVHMERGTAQLGQTKALAQMLAAKGQLGAATAHANAVVALSTKLTGSEHLFLAQLESNQGHLQPALAAAQRAVELVAKPNGREHLLLAQLCLRTKDQAGALAAYERGMELALAQGTAIAAADNQNFALLVLKNEAQTRHLTTPAREAIQRAIAASPAGATGSLKGMLASLLGREGDMAGAEASYGEAITELEAEGKLTGEEYLNYGRLLHKLERNEEALAAMERGCAIKAERGKPVGSAVLLQLAQLRLLTGDTAGSLNSAAECQGTPSEDSALLLSGQARQKSGDKEAALADFERCVALREAAGTLTGAELLLLGRALLIASAEDQDRARRSKPLIVRGFDLNTELRKADHWFLLGVSDDSRAVEAFRRCVELRGSAMDHRALGDALIAAGETDEGLQSLQRAVEAAGSEEEAAKLTRGLHQAQGRLFNTEPDVADVLAWLTNTA